MKTLKSRMNESLNEANKFKEVFFHYGTGKKRMAEEILELILKGTELDSDDDPFFGSPMKGGGFSWQFEYNPLFKKHEKKVQANLDDLYDKYIITKGGIRDVK